MIAGLRSRSIINFILFGLESNDTNMVRMSNLIEELKTMNRIKVVDVNISIRMYGYVPFCA